MQRPDVENRKSYYRFCRPLCMNVLFTESLLILLRVLWPPDVWHKPVPAGFYSFLILRLMRLKLQGPVCRLQNCLVWLSSISLNYDKPSSQSQRRCNTRALWWLVYCSHASTISRPLASVEVQITWEPNLTVALLLRVYKHSATFLLLHYLLVIFGSKCPCM